MGFAILNEILIIDEKENIVSIMDKHEKTSKKILFLFLHRRCLDFVWEQFSGGLGSKYSQNGFTFAHLEFRFKCITPNLGILEFFKLCKIT